MELQKQISMCARHHAKWKRAADFARNSAQKKKYLDRAVFWMEMQTDLVTLWDQEKTVQTPEMKRRLIQAKSNMSAKLASYGREMSQEF